jgi:hypothetical protein
MCVSVIVRDGMSKVFNVYVTSVYRQLNNDRGLCGLECRIFFQRSGLSNIILEDNALEIIHVFLDKIPTMTQRLYFV